MCAAHGGQSSDKFRACPPSLSAGIWTPTKLSFSGKRGSDLSAVISTNISRSHLVAGARDSAVGIATRYGLDGQGNESRWRRIFRTRPDGSCGPPSLLYNGYRVFTMGTGSFLGVKRLRRGVYHPPLSSAEVKERVELYLYSLSGSS